MRPSNPQALQGPGVEEEVQFTLVQLCRACDAEEEHVVAWVLEGVLQPEGESPRDWRFRGECLQRARTAWRLSHDLGINAPGVALALDLLDEIAAQGTRDSRSSEIADGSLAPSGE
jgi:chaperone modulatory protein CbpM